MAFVDVFRTTILKSAVSGGDVVTGTARAEDPSGVKGPRRDAGAGPSESPTSATKSGRPPGPKPAKPDPTTAVPVPTATTVAPAQTCALPATHLPLETLSCCNGGACKGDCMEEFGKPPQCECFGSAAACGSNQVCCKKMGCVSPETCGHAADIPGLWIKQPCNGQPCEGWCEWMQDGSQVCNCYGLSGGCHDDTRCSVMKKGCGSP
jgi:hypothetical protein